MKTKTKIKLITILIAVLACTLIAGCQVGRETYQQYVDRNNLSCHITYYANGGLFETRQNKKEVYYKPDTYAINIGVDELGGSDEEIHRDGYVFKSWCYALSENGNLVYEDAEKTIVKTGSEFDFTKKLTASTEIALYATWALDVQVEIHLAGENSVTVKDGESTKTVAPGEELTRRTFGKATQIFLTDSAPVESTDSTFLQYFTDAECKNAFDGLAVKPTEENAPNVVIYAQYMPGIYIVVKNKTQAVKMFSSMGSGKYYIYNDIDMEDSRISIARTNCTIESKENVTISNLVVNGQGSSGSYSIFGVIGSKADIKNITFANINVTYSIRGANSADRPNIVNIYAVCHDIEDGAKFENVVIKNVEMTVTAGANVQITNMLGNKTDNWLFGKQVSEGQTYSDAQFKETYGGLTVESSSITVTVDNVPVISASVQ